MLLLVVTIELTHNGIELVHMEIVRTSLAGWTVVSFLVEESLELSLDSSDLVF